MPIDLKRMNKRREEVKRASGRTGGDLVKFEEGETLILVHGLVYPDDDHELTRGYNFIELVQHYGVGGKRGGQVCLDPIANPIVLHPLVQQFLAKRKKPFKITKDTKCPVCEAIRNGELTEEEASRQAGQSKWLFGVTMMKYRESNEDEWTKKKFDPGVHIAGVKIFNGITGEMIDMGNTDITDPDAAVLLKVTRIGKGFGDTDYDISTDKLSLKDPIRLDKSQRRALLDATKPGGACDLFKVVANLMKSPVELKALMVGVKVAEDEGAGDDEERKNCFGIDFAADDAECKACPEFKDCQVAAEGDGDDGDGDEPEDTEGSDEPDPDEPIDTEGEDVTDGGGSDEPEGEEAGECFGSWEDCDDCHECADEDGCRAKTEGADEGEPEDTSEGDEPEAEPENEKGEGAGGTDGEAKDGGGEDPALAKIAAEAERLRGKRKATKGKAAKGKATKGKGK